MPVFYTQAQYYDHNQQSCCVMQVTRVGIVDANGDTVEYPASLVGSDAQHDIAVLLVDAPDQSFVPVQVGTSADLRTGQSVYAIGNPLGFSKTLTAGVVSGVNRAIPSPIGTKTYGAIQVAVLASAWLQKTLLKVMCTK